MSRFPTMKVSFTGAAIRNTKAKAPWNRRGPSQLALDLNRGGLTSTRMMVNGKTNAHRPVPCAYKCSGGAFRPFPVSPNQKALRASNVDFRGTQVSCVLLSGTARASVSLASGGIVNMCRPSTGRLMISSEAAGVYAIYDYTNASTFTAIPFQDRSPFSRQKTGPRYHVDSMTDEVENAETV